MFAQDLKLLGSGISDLQCILRRSGQEVCQPVYTNVQGTRRLPITQVSATIEVAPVFVAKPLRYKPSFNTYFSKGISGALLHPIRSTLRGMTKIIVSGRVLPEVAEAVSAEVA
jgi:hypothetical protein